MKNSQLCSKVSDTIKYNMNEKGNIEAKFLICKSGDLLLARRSQRLRWAEDEKENIEAKFLICKSGDLLLGAFNN